MERFLNGLAGVLLVAGVILAAGCAEAMNMAGVGVGLGCVVIGAIITSALDKVKAFGHRLEEGDDDDKD